MNFERIPYPVAARQFIGDNGEEVVEFARCHGYSAGAVIQTHAPYGPSVRLHAVWVYIHGSGFMKDYMRPTDWLVAVSYGDLEVWPHAQFRKSFRVATENQKKEER